jgi:hypothetical protein
MYVNLRYGGSARSVPLMQPAAVAIHTVELRGVMLLLLLLLLPPG